MKLHIISVSNITNSMPCLHNFLSQNAIKLTLFVMDAHECYIYESEPKSSASDDTSTVALPQSHHIMTDIYTDNISQFLSIVNKWSFKIFPTFLGEFTNCKRSINKISMEEIVSSFLSN